ncbi:hypothetical protein V2J09_003411 [Rumex salicifolius]
MTVEMRNDEHNDQFPVGMRVLAVDDDLICLRVLETLLRKCQYHVTSRDRAIDALELLREKRDNFDLVISDVHMPDMDGFKLLELVGLEMDLPVIMLSANGDTKMVMKGITHGACDYLLKPVRLEELKNIWQHVLRRKKTDKKDQNNTDNREKRSCPADEGQNCSRAGDSDHDGRNCKRRKDQNEDDDEEIDENGNDNEDSSSQKKARNNSYRPLPPAGMLGRLNSPAGLSIHGISPSGIAPLGHTQMTQGQITNSNKFQLPRDQTGNILQGMPTSLEFDQLQIPLKKSVVGIAGDFSSSNQASGHFSVSNGNNSLLLQDHSQGGLGNHSSLAPVSYKLDPGFGFSSSNRNTANWPSGVQSSGAQSTSFGSHVGYTQPPMVQAFNSSNNASSSALNGANELHIPSNISRFDARCQAVDLSNGGAQNMGYASKSLWNDHKLSSVHHPDFANSSMNPRMPSQSACLSSPIGNQTAMNFGGSNELGFIGHPTMDSSSAYHTTTAVAGIGSATNSGAFAVDGAGSLEDVVTSMIKWEQEGTAVSKGSDLSSYPLRTCI